MNVLDTLTQCHRIVWAYRDALEQYWPTPPVEDCLLFAFTEIGEAVDAHLRSKPEYARNRDKDLSVLDELADCALMALTALGKDYDFPDKTERQFNHKWSSYAHAVGALVYNAGIKGGDMKDWWLQDAWELLQRIATHPGMDLPTRLTARLERIKAKVNDED